MNPIDSENNFSDDDDDDDESSSSSEKVQIIKEDDEEEDSSSDSDSEDSSSDSSDSSSSSNNQEKPKTRIPYTKTPMNRGLVWRDTQDVAFKFMMDRENQIQTVHSNPTQVIYAPNGGIRGGVIQGGMGVGKTGMIFRLAFEGPNVTGFPDLAIFNLSLLSSAEEDLKKLFPKKIQKQVLFLHKSMMTAKQIKNLTRASLSKYRLVVTNYDLVRTTCYDYDFQEEIQEYAETSENDRGHVVCINERTFAQSNTFKGYTGASLLFGVPWNRVMLDESQIIRTPTAKKTIACMALYGHTKWCFSGTPIVNGSLDLWSQLRFCGFKNCKNQSEWNKESASLMHHYTLQDAIFKLDADNSGIPPLNRKMIEIDLNEFERNVYENTLEITRKILSLVKTGEVTYAFMLVMFIYLKQCMISPYLISTKSKRKSNADQTVALGDEVFNSYFDAKTIEKHEKDFEDFCKENKINVESTRSAPPALQYVPTEEEKMKSSSSIAFVGMMSPSLLSNPDVQEIRAPVPDNASKEDIEKAIISIENEINETINKKQMTDIISNIDGPAGIYCTSMNSVISFIEGINGNSDTKVVDLFLFSLPLLWPWSFY